MEFSRHEYLSGLPFPSSGDLPGPGIKPGLLHCRQILYHWCCRGSPVSKYMYVHIYIYIYNIYIVILYIFPFLLKYSLFTVLYDFLVSSKVIQLYIHIYILFHILFHYDLLQDIEYTSMCYTIELCHLSILYIIVCICQSQGNTVLLRQ